MKAVKLVKLPNSRETQKTGKLWVKRAQIEEGKKAQFSIGCSAA
jgi:hypothetical protein